VVDDSGTHFLEGLNDTTEALDVQALGAMYLQGTGQSALAAQVLAYAQKTFAISNRSITESADPSTYNLTYSAAGPFSGYAPYAGPGAPDVLWADGSGEMLLAEAALGQNTTVLAKSVADWAAITQGSDEGPLQSDRTVTSDSLDVQYHVWPAATTAAWTVLSESAPAFFAAPLPSATPVYTGPTSVDLGAAGAFAVLGASTVTSAGISTVSGDLGVSPGTAVTGFPPGAIDGTLNAGDAAGAQAHSDLATAYTNALGRDATVSILGDLGDNTHPGRLRGPGGARADRNADARRTG
jgi:Ice-binding-like